MTKILLLENTADQGILVQQELGRYGLAVTIAQSTVAAKEELDHSTAELIIIDLDNIDNHLPQFYHWLMTGPIVSHIPRMFIYSKGVEEIFSSLIQFKSEVSLAKPLRFDEFLETIKKLVSKTKLNEFIRKQQEFIDNVKSTRIGTTTIIEEIARGGMGVVYLGKQEFLNRKVAVKFLLPKAIDEFSVVKRFKDEALAIAHLKNPHIVQVFDFGELHNHIFYITMEYLPGVTLEKMVMQKGRLPFAKAVSVITQVAQGLVAAHDSGLVHRDIKPGNLIIDNKGHVSITDFGLVSSIKKKKQVDRKFITGTALYLSPEQISDTPIDGRSDIYCLGVVFYFLLVGKPPFMSQNPIDIIMSHLNERVPDPRHEVPNIPQELIDILERMTAKNPDERYINCRELIWDLQACNVNEYKDGRFTAAPTQPAPTKVVPKEPAPIYDDMAIFHEGSKLKKWFPDLINANNVISTVIMSESGDLTRKRGDFNDTIRNTLFILQKSTLELNAVLRLGGWSFSIVEKSKELYTLFPEKNGGYGAMNLKRVNAYSVSSGATPNMTKTSGKHRNTTDVLQQILSVSGVHELLLFSDNGELLEHETNKQMLDLSQRYHLTPIIQLMTSLSNDCIGVDLWYSQGRVLLWPIEKYMFVVIADLEVNRSFLYLYISGYLQHVLAKTQEKKGETPLTEFSFPEPTKKVGEDTVIMVKHPVAHELMDLIQLETAKIVGPIAKLLLRKECIRLRYTRESFPKEKLNDLVMGLGRSVDKEHREEFITNTLEVITNFE